MEFKYFQRDERVLSEIDLNEISNIILSLPSSENSLLVFQLKTDNMIVTNQKIIFTKGNKEINFEAIKKVNILSDLQLEIFLNNKSNSLIIDFTDPISKVKIYKMIQLIIQNLKMKNETHFDQILALFDSQTIIKYPPKQDQHQLPQVYLKQFGYKDKDQWKVSVLYKGEDFIRQKSIGSFTAMTNIFDIDSEDDRIPRIFEELNCELENEYLNIIQDIENNEIISLKSYAFLIQLAANLMIRSDYWREFVSSTLSSDNKQNFLIITLSFLFKDINEIDEIKNQEPFKMLNEAKVTDDLVNRVLIYLIGYLFNHMQMLDVVIIEAPEDKGWFTSDLPVYFIPNQETGRFGLFSTDTEIYFPISKKYLAYFHYPKSESKQPSLRRLKNMKVYRALDIMNEGELEELIKNNILKVSQKFLIFPIEFKYRIERNSDL